MGIALLQAQKSDVGQWEYQEDGSSSAEWKPLETSDDLMIPSGLVTEHTYRGPIAITEYMERLACEYDRDSPSLTTPAEAKCWQKISCHH